jgi:hypothetical protein
VPSVSGAGGHNEPELTLAGPVLTLGGLQKLIHEIGPDSAAVVVVNRTSNLSLSNHDNLGVASQWWNAVRDLAADRLTVVVNEAIPTGTAGALLYALATERVIAYGATVTQLPPMLTAGQSPACDSGLCAPLSSEAITVATGSPQADLGTPVVLPAPPGGGQSPWLIVALIVAALAALWFAGGNRVVRRLVGRPAAATGYGVGAHGVSWAVPVGTGTGVRGPGDARGPEGVRGPGGVLGESGTTRRLPVTFYDPSTGGRRQGPTSEVAQPGLAHGPGQGIVRTAMGPEGYVEIDGVLYRATWRGSRAAPRRGSVVKVGQDSHGELVAVEDGPANGGSGQARP